MKTAILIVAAALVALIMVMWRYAPAQTQEERAACTADAMKFCGAELSQGHDAAKACLQKHRSQVSKECADVLARRKL
jgi:hypothetical protein